MESLLFKHSWQLMKFLEENRDVKLFQTTDFLPSPYIVWKGWAANPNYQYHSVCDPVNFEAWTGIELYVEPWQYQIPEEGILCWVWDDDDPTERSVDIIVRYREDDNNYNYCSYYTNGDIIYGNRSYKNAQPVKKSEIEKYLGETHGIYS